MLVFTPGKEQNLKKNQIPPLQKKKDLEYLCNNNVYPHIFVKVFTIL